jgi:hypothetical protein
MNAADLREVVTLQRLDASKEPGEWIDLDYTPTMKAAVESQGGESYRIRIRYRADLFGFKDTHPAMCVVWNKGPSASEQRILDVIDVVETDRGREITLIASSRQIETENLPQGARRTQAWR